MHFRTHIELWFCCMGAFLNMMLFFVRYAVSELRGFQFVGFKFELPLFKVVRYLVLNSINHEVSAVT